MPEIALLSTTHVQLLIYGRTACDIPPPRGRREFIGSVKWLGSHNRTYFSLLDMEKKSSIPTVRRRNTRPPPNKKSRNYLAGVCPRSLTLSAEWGRKSSSSLLET